MEISILLATIDQKSEDQLEKRTCLGQYDGRPVGMPPPAEFAGILQAYQLK